MGVDKNTTNTPQPNLRVRVVDSDKNYDVIDVDSEQDKFAAALVQSVMLTNQRLMEEKNMENNNNNNMSAQDLLAMQQLQQMQSLQKAGEQAGSVLMTGLKYGAAFGAGFLGCKLLSSNSNSKDTSELLGCVSELFK